MHTLVVDTVSIAPARHGLGLFANFDIPPRTHILTYSGTETDLAGTLSLGEQEGHTIQVGIDRYLFPEPPFLYINHSCEPNCGLSGRNGLISIKPIRAGEELCFDYSTSMMERHWRMQCYCGASACRGIVDDFDTLPRELQQYYLANKTVARYIMALHSTRKR